MSRCFVLALAWLLGSAGTVAGQAPPANEAFGTPDGASSAYLAQPVRAAAVMDPRLHPSLRAPEQGWITATCTQPNESRECDARLATLVGGAVGVGGALLYCSYDDCDVAIFVYAMLGGYLGGTLGKLIRCGPAALRGPDWKGPRRPRSNRAPA